jgi:two-component system chemotaxis response regulator CheB
VLQQILSGLPDSLPVPVLIVQHMSPGFLGGFAEWLSASSGIPVHIASDGEVATPGHAYLAPDSLHMGLGADMRITLSDGPEENGFRPSVSHLFRSVANAVGPRAVAVLLTGMGHDGADALKVLHDGGAMTIAQDEDSSAVHGMPGTAIKLGAVTHVLAPRYITALLADLAIDDAGARP